MSRMLNAKMSSTERDVSSGKDDSAYISFENMKEEKEDVDSKLIAELKLEMPNVKLNDIGGLQIIRDALTKLVALPLKYPELIKRSKIVPAKGILLYGPSGCNKTMIAEAFALENKFNFISVKGPNLLDNFKESGKSIYELFKKARSTAPCILFFHDLDSMAPIRCSTSGNSNISDNILSQLIAGIDGTEALEGVYILADTNRPDMIDGSLLRPGRFDHLIYIPLPDADTRRQIFVMKLKDVPTSLDVDLSYLVQATKGFTVTEIIAVCHKAAMSVVEECFTPQPAVMKMCHFLSALKSVVPSTSKEMIELYENYNNIHIDVI